MQIKCTMMKQKQEKIISEPYIEELYENPIVHVGRPKNADSLSKCRYVNSRKQYIHKQTLKHCVCYKKEDIMSAI